MNLLVLGASGGIGRWAVQLAFARGHAVRALVRSGTDYQAPTGVEVVRGDALDPTVLRAAAAGVRRLVVVSAAGAGESIDQLSGPVRWMVRQGHLAVAYRDLGVMEQVVADSDVDWLLVRPVTLKDGPPTGRAREVPRNGLLSSVRRSDVAAWLLDAVETAGALGRRAVLVGEG